MAVSVLIVEDDRNIAELLQLYLEKEGYAVTTAADGGQGMSKFRAIKPDLGQERQQRTRCPSPAQTSPCLRCPWHRC